ncbi:MAG: hypothetical protein ACI9LN_004666 [Saprospiraceae bacterium]|jgi:hypothetical protein
MQPLLVAYGVACHSCLFDGKANLIFLLKNSKCITFNFQAIKLLFAIQQAIYQGMSLINGLSRQRCGRY